MKAFIFRTFPDYLDSGLLLFGCGRAHFRTHLQDYRRFTLAGEATTITLFHVFSLTRTVCSKHSARKYFRCHLVFLPICFNRSRSQQ